MPQVYKILTALLLVLVSNRNYGQEVKAIFGENSTEYKRQIVGGPLLHTAGYGGFFAWGKRVNGFKQRMIQIEAVTLKHEKEYRSINPDYADSKSYVFGKVNQAFLLRPTIGYKHQKYDKLRPAGVEVGYEYAIGPSIAVLKPVYLEIGYPEFPYEYLEVEKYDPEVHTSDRIFGRASTIKGIDELKFLAGIHAKFGMVFEYSSYSTGIKGIGIGATIDAFPKKVPIMAFNKNHGVFFNFYVQLMFGKKYIQ